MNETTRICHVTFLSPGTFMSEQTTMPIASWDTVLACDMATNVSERYGAKPYAFYFTTSISAPDVPDGLGGTLRVQPREVERSGRHHLGGVVLTVDDVQGRPSERDESILISNMRYNWPIVCETRNSFLHVAPFEERDVVVDPRGVIVERGDTPERITYRARFLAA